MEFRERVGIVPEGFQQMEEKRLRLAFFVAFEFGGERGEIMESAFLRCHPEPDCAPKIYQRQSVVKPVFSTSHPRQVS